MKVFAKHISMGVSGRDLWFSDGDCAIPVSIPAYAAVSGKTGKFYAFGTEAFNQREQDTVSIDVECVLREGRIINFDGAAGLLHYGFNQFGVNFLRPKVYAAIPRTNDISSFYSQAMKKGGAGDITFLDNMLCALLGLELEVNRCSATGVMIIERDWFEFGIIKSGQVLASFARGFGLEDMLDDVGLYFRRRIGIFPDKKESFDAIFSTGIDSDGKLKGWDSWVGNIETGSTNILEYTAENLQIGIYPSLLRFCGWAADSIGNITPKNLNSLRENGIYLLGDAAYLSGFPELLNTEMGIPIHPVESSVPPVLKGAIEVMEMVKSKRHKDAEPYILSSE